MAMLEDFGKRATQAGQSAVRKTKNVTDITRLNSLINETERTIRATYTQIGELYVNLHAKDPEEKFRYLVNTVSQCQANIQEYQLQIDDIKGVRRCTVCGAEIPKNAAFCSACGTPVPKVGVPSEEMIQCPHCGATVLKRMKFCIYCGKPVAPGAQVPAAPAPVQQGPVAAVQTEPQQQQTATSVAPVAESSSSLDAQAVDSQPVPRIELEATETSTAPSTAIVEEPLGGVEDVSVPTPTSTAESSILCRHCGATNRPGARFCTTCGNSLAEEVPEDQDDSVQSLAQQPVGNVQPKLFKICPNCGAQMDLDMSFCSECGMRLP